MKKIIMIITLLFICCCNISRAERVALNDYMDKTQFIQTYNQNMNKLKYPFKLDYIHPLNSNNYAYIITCYPYKEHEKFYTIHTNRAGNIMFISISLNKDLYPDKLQVATFIEVIVSLLSLGIPREYFNGESEMTKAINKVIYSNLEEDSSSFWDTSCNKRYNFYKEKTKYNFLTITITSSNV